MSKPNKLQTKFIKRIPFSHIKSKDIFEKLLIQWGFQPNKDFRINYYGASDAELFIMNKKLFKHLKLIKKILA